MAVITQTIQPGERRNEVTEIQKAFIILNASIDASKIFTPTTAGTYGPTTLAAVIALLQRFGFETPSPPIFNARAGRLLNIAVGAESGNSAALLSGRGIYPPDWAGVHNPNWKRVNVCEG
jgi:peptidoglycan hydrolase-like protein with peptidoglycan-binding domain